MEKFWTRLGLPKLDIIMFVLNILLQVSGNIHYVLSCSYRIFICHLPFYLSMTEFGVVMYYIILCVAILSDCMGLNLASYSSYYTFHFIGKKNNFEKHPDCVPFVFPNKQRAKRVVTPSRSIHRIRRNSIDTQENVKCKSKPKKTLISNKESRTQRIGHAAYYI